MTSKTVSITYERKFNLGDYNSVHIGLTLWADCDEGESHIDVARQLQADARELAKAEYLRVVKPGKLPANGTV